MRLLDVNTYGLEEFLDDSKRPKYAILSHTWGEEEVLYQNIANLEACTTKAGWAKIEYTCGQARADGFTHAWIDTCCIDKTSSAELSEAINSMYKWYEDSEVCYAYLIDVEAPVSVPSGPCHQESQLDASQSKFAASRWFTRGWTLQELIAPTTLRFYDRNWELLGLSQELVHLVAFATTIPPAVLTKSIDIYGVSLAKRLSWAARRHTTRVEDEAYSLLGILDVNMPLLYGEGKKAFRRLQETVVATSRDQSLFARSRVRSPSYMDKDTESILADSAADFADCGYILQKPYFYDCAYNIVNDGLHISLPISHSPGLHDFYIANLNCFDSRLPGNVSLMLKSRSNPGPLTVRGRTTDMNSWRARIKPMVLSTRPNNLSSKRERHVQVLLPQVTTSSHWQLELTSACPEELRDRQTSSFITDGKHNIELTLRASKDTVSIEEKHVRLHCWPGPWGTLGEIDWCRALSPLASPCNGQACRGGSTFHLDDTTSLFARLISGNIKIYSMSRRDDMPIFGRPYLGKLEGICLCGIVLAVLFALPNMVYEHCHLICFLRVLQHRSRFASFTEMIKAWRGSDWDAFHPDLIADLAAADLEERKSVGPRAINSVGQDESGFKEDV